MIVFLLAYIFGLIALIGICFVLTGYVLSSHNKYIAHLEAKITEIEEKLK